MVTFAAVESRLPWAKTQYFWCGKLSGMLTGLVLIPVLYYTYTGAFGISWDWFNITIFFLAAMAAYRLETVVYQRHKSCRLPEWATIALLLVIGLLFLLFTFCVPEIQLFADPRK